MIVPMLRVGMQPLTLRVARAQWWRDAERPKRRSFAACGNDRRNRFTDAGGFMSAYDAKSLDEAFIHAASLPKKLSQTLPRDVI